MPRLSKFVGVLLLAGGTLFTGCASDSKKPTAKAEATEKWNGARAAVLTSLANEQFKAGQFDKCRKSVDDAMKLAPNNPALHILSAKLYIEQGQLEAAERELSATRVMAPNDGEANYLSGVIYQRWQKPETALSFYQAAAVRSPAELPYYLAQAEMLVAMDRTPEAFKLLRDKADYFEHSSAIRDACGQLLMQLNKPAEAVAMFRQASILAEDDLSIRERLGTALYKNKDYRESAEVLSKTVQNESFAKRTDLWQMIGDSYLQTGRPRDARSAYETATTIDANSAVAWRGLGRSALEIGDYKRAELSLTRSLKIDAGRAETYLLLGYVKLRQDQFKEARGAFEKASQLDPSDTVSLCMIGYALERSGNPRAAAPFYAQALRIKPSDELAQQLMAGVNLND